MIAQVENHIKSYENRLLGQKIMLPFNEGGPETVEMDCRRMREREIPEQARVACFMAGDPRANEQTGLTVMHTVFLRAHNRIASELYDLNRSLNGDEIYFTTRKIIGALMQKFTYNEWLPAILGTKSQTIIETHRGPQMNIDITGALFTLCLSILILNSQCNERHCDANIMSVTV